MESCKDCRPCSVHAAPPSVQQATALTSAQSAGHDEAFWAKLEEVKAKYLEDFRRLIPLIKRLQESQPREKRELFLKHVRDCINVMELSRQDIIPPKVTLTVLERVETFVSQVIIVYVNYDKALKDSGARSALNDEMFWGDEMFWAKQEEIKTKYLEEYRRLMPFIKVLQKYRPREKREVFLKHVRDAMKIMKLSRQDTIPARLSLRVLERAENFVRQVIKVYGDCEKSWKAKFTQSAGDEEKFWVKLEQLKTKYLEEYRRLMPLVELLQKSEPKEKREVFLKHVRDAMNIMGLSRRDTIAPRLSLTVLERTEKFVRQVIKVHGDCEKSSKASGPTFTQSAGDEEKFWIKLEQLKTKYLEEYRRVMPLVELLQKSEPKEKREVFLKHIRDAMSIMELSRQDTIPPRLSLTVLERAENFVRQVIEVYDNDKYWKALKDSIASTASS